VAPPFRQAEFDIMFGEGISKWGELVDMAVDFDVIQKAGSWFSMNGERIGQGKDSVKRYLIDNPDIADDVEAQVRAKLAETTARPGAAPQPAEAADRAVSVSAEDFDDEL
ncbi:MAG: DNA recombination/repair protein RecA, partial [Oscillospiraceae bacterium]|nr:DNA recombination/repair protein RecA [Oscillospiraceae bacterium]